MSADVGVLVRAHIICMYGVNRCLWVVLVCVRVCGYACVFLPIKMALYLTELGDIGIDAVSEQGLGPVT